MSYWRPGKVVRIIITNLKFEVVYIIDISRVFQRNCIEQSQVSYTFIDLESHGYISAVRRRLCERQRGYFPGGVSRRAQSRTADWFCSIPIYTGNVIRGASSCFFPPKIQD